MNEYKLSWLILATIVLILGVDLAQAGNVYINGTGKNCMVSSTCTVWHNVSADDVIKVNVTSAFNLTNNNAAGINIWFDLNLTPQTSYGLYRNKSDASGALDHIMSFETNSSGNVSLNISYLNLTTNATYRIQSTQATYNQPGVRTVTNNLNMNNYSLLNEKFAVRNVSRNYTVSTQNDRYISCDATAGTLTITLPRAQDNVGRLFTIKKKDATSGLCAVNSSSIDGAGWANLSAQYSAITVISDITEWNVI